MSALSARFKPRAFLSIAPSSRPAWFAGGGYHVFAPEPGPSHLVRYEVTRADGSQVEGILYASDNTDITRAFISDYNLKNPATASITTPK